MEKITILGQTPSLKNNKQIAINRKTGSTFITSSKKVKDWQQSSLQQLKNFKKKFDGKVIVHYKFYVKDNIQRDIDNMITSVNDILQQANASVGLGKNGKPKLIKGTGIIAGDHWQVLSIGSASAEIDKDNPRAEITIEKL